MVNGTIRLDGKKHSMLREFVNVFEYLGSIDGVEKVDMGRFADKGVKNGNVYDIKYYNKTTRTMRVEIRGKKGRELFYLKINPDKREEVERGLEKISEFL